MSRSQKTDYPNHERASKAYTIYISGYTQEEIAKFLGCSLEDVEADITHMHSVVNTPTIIRHENDRNRILIQRTEGERYRKMLAQTLSIPAEQYLAAGITPVGPMKEFREAVGMVVKPDAVGVHVSQTQVNVSGGGSTISSSEDLLRSVMAKLKTNYDSSQEPIDVEVVDPAPEDSGSVEADSSSGADAVPDPDGD